MKKPAGHSIWIFWLPLGLAITIFFLVTFVGNILVIGSKLAAFHPVAEWAFYGGLSLVFIWLIAAPLVGVLAAPVMALENVANGTSKTDHKTLKKIARQLVNSGGLATEHHAKLSQAIGLGSDLRELLAAAINAQKESAAIIIREHAVIVFVTTAVSQNGRLDAIAVLTANFRLVRKLVRHLGYRPPLPMLVKIYAQIFLAALVADKLDDLDLAGGIEQLVKAGTEISHGALHLIGGTASVASGGKDGGGFSNAASAISSATKPLMNAALDGTINALLTLRVGFVARKCLLNAGSNLTRSEIRKVANREARQELQAVWKDALPVLPSAAKQLVEKWL
jgi:membrane protein implicated in regulation of membrane protease activity